jgi:hypothetical protein
MKAGKKNSRKSIYAEEIAEKGRSIAEIAALLMKDGRDESEATLTALRLLELQEFALTDLRVYRDIESGVAKWKSTFEHAASAIPYNYKNGESGDPLPVPFEEGLKVLMPRLRKHLRMPRFLEFLIDDDVQRNRCDPHLYGGLEAFAKRRRDLYVPYIEGMREDGFPV